MTTDEIMALADEYAFSAHDVAIRPYDKYYLESKKEDRAALRAAVEQIVRERDEWRKEADMDAKARESAEAERDAIKAPLATDAAPAPDDARDAARYQFAKSMEGQVLVIDVFRNHGADALDAAIDAAMKEKP